MNLPPQNKERFISEISNFGLGEQIIRVCVNDPINYHLITGDENGRITIWNLKNGKPIYIWEAHPNSPITKNGINLINIYYGLEEKIRELKCGNYLIYF